MTQLNRNNSNWSFEERRKINENWDILEGLANSTASGNNGLKSEVDELKVRVATNTATANNALQVANQNNQKVDSFSTRIEESINQSLEATNNSVNATENAVAATGSANAAATNANVAYETAQSLIENIEGYDRTISDFSINETFLRNQNVRFNGSTYRAKVRTTGNPLPTPPELDNQWWSLVSQRGVDGTGAVSSVNGILPNTNGDILLPDLTEELAQTEKKVENIIHVDNLGAIADDSFDNAVIINKAITDLSNAGGGIVQLGEGTYRVKRCVLRTNVTLRGRGFNTVLKSLDNGDVVDNVINMSGSSDMRIEDMTLDGNRANNTTRALHGLYILQVSRLKVNNVRIINASGEGVFIGYTGSFAEDVELSNIYISNSGRNDFYIGNGRNVTARNVNIESTNATSGSVDIEKHADEDILENILLENFSINTGNQPVKLISNGYLGNMNNIRLSNITLTGNTPTISLNQVDNVTLENCMARTYDISGSENIQFINSTAQNSTSSGLYAYASTDGRKTKNLKIKNSSFLNNRLFGVLLQDVDFALIEDSKILNNADGIGIYFATTNVNILNNRISDDRSAGSKTQNYAVRYEGNTHSNINFLYNKTVGNINGEFFGMVIGRTIYRGNTASRNQMNFASLGNDSSHIFTYTNDGVLDWSGLIRSRRFMLSQQYADAAVPNGSIYEDTDGKLKYKNLAGVVTDLTL